MSPLLLRGMSMGIPIIIPIRGRGFINEGSTLLVFPRLGPSFGGLYNQDSTT